VSRRFVSVSPALLLLVACAGLEGLDLSALEQILTGGTLDESTVAAGLAEALEVGSERACSELARPGGFSGNPLLRLSLPAELDPLTRSLRSVGLGSQIDRLEDAMNLAAERAAGEAVPVFVDAIRALTIRDAFEILDGPDDAATVYLREQTGAPLRARFEPVVTGAMEAVGLYRIYAELVVRYEALPFAKPAAPDLDAYVTDRALDGLFETLAAEEARIRADPAARTTALLRRVFGAGRAAAASSGAEPGGAERSSAS
jgi:hypothetical protein